MANFQYSLLCELIQVCGVKKYNSGLKTVLPYTPKFAYELQVIPCFLPFGQTGMVQSSVAILLVLKIYSQKLGGKEMYRLTVDLLLIFN